jgi:hypothetical protein
MIRQRDSIVLSDTAKFGLGILRSRAMAKDSKHKNIL